jgi:hypothetical protein
MGIHQGHIVERVVRRNHYTISYIAQVLNVNRRTVYNWFSQPVLKTAILYQLGVAIKHDFSLEFPELFHEGDSGVDEMTSLPERLEAFKERDNELVWRGRYLRLLYRFNRFCEENGLNH